MHKSSVDTETVSNIEGYPVSRSLRLHIQDMGPEFLEAGNFLRKFLVTSGSPAKDLGDDN